MEFKVRKETITEKTVFIFRYKNAGNSKIKKHRAFSYRNKSKIKCTEANHLCLAEDHQKYDYLDTCKVIRENKTTYKETRGKKEQSEKKMAQSAKI